MQIPTIDGYLEPRFRSNSKKEKIKIFLTNVICDESKIKNKQSEKNND